MAKLIKEGIRNGRQYIVYACSKCGAEVTLCRHIGDKNTYCGKCMHTNKTTCVELGYRKKERDEILDMVEEIRRCHLFCMQDMCFEPEKDCGLCALDWIIERIKARDGKIGS